MNYDQIISDLDARVLPISAPGDTYVCEECGIWTDTAISYNRNGMLHMACTRHVPVDGRTRDEQWELIQHLLHGAR